MRARTRAAAALLSAAALLPLAACTPPGQVMVVGDSLTVQATPHLQGAHVHGWAGTAPCDWQSRFRKLFDADRPAVVVFAFVGNTGTGCMAGTEDPATLASRYRTALADMAGYAIRLHARVRFLIPPAAGPRPWSWRLIGDPQIGREECRLAATARAQAVCSTAAHDLLTPGGVYDPTYRTDGVHLNDAGARLYARGILTAAQ